MYFFLSFDYFLYRIPFALQVTVVNNIDSAHYDCLKHLTIHERFIVKLGIDAMKKLYIHSKDVNFDNLCDFCSVFLDKNKSMIPCVWKL